MVRQAHHERCQSCVLRRAAVAFLCMRRTHGDGTEGRSCSGFDGMDYQLTRELIAQGRLPNLAQALRKRDRSRRSDRRSRRRARWRGPRSSPAWIPDNTRSSTSSTATQKRSSRILSTTKTEGAGRSIKIGKLPVPADRREGGTAAPRRGVLGAARTARRRDDDHAACRRTFRRPAPRRAS